MKPVDEDRSAAARARRDRFVAANPERLAWLEEQVAAAPPPAPKSRRWPGARRPAPAAEPFRGDRTRAGLEPLWRWALTQVAYRDPALPRIDPWTPDPTQTWVPERFRDSDAWWPKVAVYAPGTIVMADAVGRYLGECLIEARPGAHWAEVEPLGDPTETDGEPVVLLDGVGTARPYGAGLWLAFWALRQEFGRTPDPGAPRWLRPWEPTALAEVYDEELRSLDGLPPGGGSSSAAE